MAASEDGSAPGSAATALPGLLDYERQLVSDLIEEDALCVLASGLAWQKAVAVFVRLHEAQQPGPVLLIGFQPWQRQLLNKELRRHDPAARLPLDVNAEVPAAERTAHYAANACCFVTTRILVVDLLCARVAPRNIAGMIVVNAHRVTETSGEGFAVRLYRAANKTGFLRRAAPQPPVSLHCDATFRNILA